MTKLDKIKKLADLPFVGLMRLIRLLSEINLVNFDYKAIVS